VKWITRAFNILAALILTLAFLYLFGMILVTAMTVPIDSAGLLPSN
jgi:hypothetical protein